MLVRTVWKLAELFRAAWMYVQQYNKQYYAICRCNGYSCAPCVERSRDGSCVCAYQPYVRALPQLTRTYDHLRTDPPPAVNSPNCLRHLVGRAAVSFISCLSLLRIQHAAWTITLNVPRCKRARGCAMVRYAQRGRASSRQSSLPPCFSISDYMF